MASLPKIDAAYWACCSSVKPANLVLSSSITSLKGSIFPFASVIDKPKSSIALDIFPVGLARLVMALLKEVPACELLIPALAIRPRASAASSAEYPKEPKSGATYLKDSPSIDTLVLALLEVLA